jgi:hypothetical protein
MITEHSLNIRHIKSSRSSSYNDNGEPDNNSLSKSIISPDEFSIERRLESGAGKEEDYNG